MKVKYISVTDIELLEIKVNLFIGELILEKARHITFVHYGFSGVKETIFVCCISYVPFYNHIETDKELSQTFHHITLKAR